MTKNSHKYLFTPEYEKNHSKIAYLLKKLAIRSLSSITSLIFQKNILSYIDISVGSKHMDLKLLDNIKTTIAKRFGY